MSENEIPLTAEDVAEIAEILEKSGYREVDIATSRFRLRVAKGDGEDGGMTQEWQWAGTAQSANAEDAAEVETDPDCIGAPLPGTFYHAPSPGAPPFVTVGDTVGPETVVGIVETMKLMNPVHAGREGTVADVLVPNATMVAKGQSLIRIS
ncbi:biotin/lipoyl-containing protein [Novosphingobium sp. ZN18A2]|uniref:acetyl-CoA carboxylase biotin carboxyl carrier protein n=1 Tax=Novosphingobium sp. ZN18A2 TaxID=3079861 RepID=UPI0030CED5E6